VKTRLVVGAGTFVFYSAGHSFQSYIFINLFVVCFLRFVCFVSATQDPYLEIPEAKTYELTSCYNVTIDCRSTDMIVRVKTNRIFSGKLYAKERPNSCVTDVARGLEFELKLGYQDLGCDVKQEGPGKFFTEVVIQVQIILNYIMYRQV
jgi:hypothetical protein